MNSSLASSISYSESWSEEQEMAMYKTIKMNLQVIRKSTYDINLKLKNLQKEMRTTAALIDAVKSKDPVIDQD